MSRTFLKGVDLNSQKATSVLDPTSAQDAATKNYVDTFLEPVDPHDSGYKAWNYDPLASGASSSSLVSGQTVFHRLRISYAQTITGVGVYMNTAASGLTNGFAALYSVSGTTATRVAVSANTTTWATGSKQIAFTGTYAASVGIFYVGLLVFGTTPPAMAGSVSTTGNIGYLAAPWRFALQTATAQTATPSSIDLSSGMGSTTKTPWVGLY